MPTLQSWFELCAELFAGRQRQFYSAYDALLSTSLQHDKAAANAAGGVRRPADRKEDSSIYTSTAFRGQKGSVVGSGPPRLGHSVLGPLCASPRRRRELKLVLSSAFGALSSAPQRQLFL